MEKLEAGERAVAWIELLTLSDDFAGKPFKLMPWQAGIITQLFGTLTPEGLRRFRTCLLFIARKNAKTQLVAGIAIYWLFGLGKQEQEIILGTSSIEQSRILYKKIIGTIRRNTWLSKQIKEIKATREIRVPSTGNLLKIISNKGDLGQGFNPSLAIIDELHTQLDNRLYAALTSGSGTRQEPLVIMMTTAGSDRESVAFKEYEYACKVRDGIHVDSTYLPVIYECPPDADIYDPANWLLANPALGPGGFLQMSYMESQAVKAKGMHTDQYKFMQYNLNMWVAGGSKWLDYEKWSACGGALDLAALQGEPCWAGLDLSNTSDISALVLVFKVGDDFAVLSYFWMPEKVARGYDAKGFTHYAEWFQQGFITLTDGDLIDYDLIKAQVLELSMVYDIQEIRFDPWNSTQIAFQLYNAGLPMVEMRQGFISMNEPTKYLEWLIGMGRVRHGSSPVLDMMADNACVERDSHGNVKVTKGKAGAKVDGIVALAMAVGAVTGGVAPPEAEIILLGRSDQ